MDKKGGWKRDRERDEDKRRESYMERAIERESKEEDELIKRGRNEG